MILSVVAVLKHAVLSLSEVSDFPALKLTDAKILYCINGMATAKIACAWSTKQKNPTGSNEPVGKHSFTQSYLELKNLRKS